MILLTTWSNLYVWEVIRRVPLEKKHINRHLPHSEWIQIAISRHEVEVWVPCIDLKCRHVTVRLQFIVVPLITSSLNGVHMLRSPQMRVRPRVCILIQCQSQQQRAGAGWARPLARARARQQSHSTKEYQQLPNQLIGQQHPHGQLLGRLGDRPTLPGRLGYLLNVVTKLS